MSDNFAAIVDGLELKIKALEERLNESVQRNYDSYVFMAPYSVFEAEGTEPSQVDAGWQPMGNRPCQLLSRAVGNCRSIWADNNATNCFLVQPVVSGELYARLGSMSNTFGNKWNNTGTPDYLTPIESLCHEKPRNDILYSTKLDESYNEFTNVEKESKRNMVIAENLPRPGCNGFPLEAPGNSSRSMGLPCGLPMAGCTGYLLEAPDILGSNLANELSLNWVNAQDCLLNREALIKWIFKNLKNELIKGLIAGVVADKGFSDSLMKELLKQCPNFIDYNALLDLDEVSTYLKVSLRTVNSLIKEGKLKTKKVGNQHRISLSDLKVNLNLGRL